ncbi:hypothetical protein EDD22DRAFT_958264 [Suillus occidentalis]|nr:hypothetical protein EDD22DRAFT_958264 [Suillus occidentalis]
MSSSLRTESSTVSFRTPEHDTLGHSRHPIGDGNTTVEETAADKIPAVDSATVKHTAPMAIDARPSSPERTSSTVSSHHSGERAAGHSSDRTEDGSHRSEACNAVQPVIDVKPTAPAPLDAKSLSRERTSSTVSSHPSGERAAGHSLDRTEDGSHHSEACNAVQPVIDVKPTAPAPLDAKSLSREKISSTVSPHSTSDQSAANPSSDRVGDAPHRSAYASK